MILFFLSLWMGCFSRATVFWIMKLTDPRILFISLFLILSDAAHVVDFPGATVCLEDGIEIIKPRGIRQSSWQSLHVVDSAGFGKDACDIHPDGNLMVIPERCAAYEMGRKVSYISYDKITGQKSFIYKITCNEQADSPVSSYSGPIIECNNNYMTAKISRVLLGFADEVPFVPPPVSTWAILINNRAPKVNISTASKLGYRFTSDPQSLMVRINFDAFGIKKTVYLSQNFYSGYIELIQEKLNPKITIAVTIMCAAGPPDCNKTHMNILIPPLAGVLRYMELNKKPVSLSAQALKVRGITLDTRSGVHLSIDRSNLQVSTHSYSLDSLLLVFDKDEVSVAMDLSLTCAITGPPYTPSVTTCTRDGLMTIQITSTLTQPILDLNTVTVRDHTCQPYQKSSNSIVFQFPLNSCGTASRFVGGKLFYENEVRALWRDLPPRKISRDSELRETVWCFFNVSMQESLNVTMVTHTPLASAKNDGPLSLVLNLFPDVSYGKPYSDDQYPVVKTLRDPIFLEVQVLNRDDPNIELVLDDCWATILEDPKTNPQWNVVVDGCQENQDSDLTVFHSVSNVAQPSHRKRFEVKAFAFVLGNEPSTNLIYFHCTAFICNLQLPDSALCTKKCPMSRKRRDDLFLHRRSTLVSLKGPLLFDAVPALNLHGKQDVVEQVTIGVLPAFGLVALVVLAAVLRSALKRKSKS